MNRLQVPRHRRLLLSSNVLFLASLLGCGSDAGHPSVVPSPSASPTAAPIPSPSGSIIYFVADPDRIKRGEASDLRWECAGDVPYVQIAMLLSNQIIGPFPARGTVRVRPKQDEFYSLRPQSTNNVQVPSQTVHIFVTP